MSARAFEAGIAAGRRWAARNRARRDRIHFWASQPINAVSRFPIYAVCLTDRFMVDAPIEGSQQYSVPMLKAERLADAYWGRLKSWPRGPQRQARFVEGFVRGAAKRQ